LEPLPAATYLLADTAYDSDGFRALLINRGSTPVIRPNPTRKNLAPFDVARYRGRNVIERAFSHLKAPLTTSRMLTVRCPTPRFPGGISGSIYLANPPELLLPHS
jgi:transposase